MQLRCFVFLLFLIVKQNSNAFNNEIKWVLTSNWKPLRCGLWIDTNNNLGMLSSQLINESGKRIDYFVDHFYDEKWTPLKNIIDTNSFKFLNIYYALDKNRVYYMSYHSNGVNIFILKAIKSKNMIAFDSSSYCSDSKHVYFRGSKIKEADYKTFKIIDEFTAYDQFHIYFYGEILNEEEIEARNLKAYKNQIKSK